MNESCTLELGAGCSSEMLTHNASFKKAVIILFYFGFEHVVRLKHASGYCRHCDSYSRIDSTKSLASGAVNVSGPGLMSQVGIVGVGQCVSAVREVEVPVLVCLLSSCNHVTEEGRRVYELVPKVVNENDGDFANVILL
jgi:hypothetical protein